MLPVDLLALNMSCKQTYERNAQSFPLNMVCVFFNLVLVIGNWASLLYMTESHSAVCICDYIWISTYGRLYVHLLTLCIVLVWIIIHK